MNTLLITSFFPPIEGGSAVVYGNFFKYSDGHVFVLTASYDCQTNQKIPISAQRNDKNIYQVKLVRPPYLRPKNIFQSVLNYLCYDIRINFNLATYIIYIIKKHNISTVVLGELHSLSWSLVFIKKLFPKISVIFYTHGEELTTNNGTGNIFKHSMQRIQSADGVICVSSFTRDVLINHWQLPKEKVFLVPNGIDIDSVNERKNTLTKPKFLPNNSFIFSVGRHIERKGFDHLIQAMPAVLKLFPDVKLCIGGTGEFTTNLEDIITEKQLSESVILLGRLTQEELTYCYSHCLFFAMPNRTLPNGDTEGFGLVFLEANAYGKAVIAGNAGGATDAVSVGQSGILVQGDDIDSISNGIIELLTNETYKNFEEGAYSFVQSNDVKLKIVDLLDVIKKIHLSTKC